MVGSLPRWQWSSTFRSHDDANKSLHKQYCAFNHIDTLLKLFGFGFRPLFLWMGFSELGFCYWRIDRVEKRRVTKDMCVQVLQPLADWSSVKHQSWVSNAHGRLGLDDTPWGWHYWHPVDRLRHHCWHCCWRIFTHQCLRITSTVLVWVTVTEMMINGGNEYLE